MEIAKKRLRREPTKKWTVEEEKKLIDFLKENRNFEESKPTAQNFYTEFSSSTGVVCSWHLVRSKVRNMRVKYNKAKAYENSTGAGATKEGETMKDVLEKMCSFYSDFDDIFHGRLVDDIEVCESESPNTENIPAVENPTSDIVFTSPTPRSGKGIYSRTALSEIIEKQDSLIEFKKRKLESEEAFNKASLQLERDKFEYEKKKQEEELKLRRLEIESNERIKMLDLELAAKIKMKELELNHK